MRNWKTTLTSVVSAIGSFVIFAEQTKMIDFPDWAMAVALFMAAGGLVAFGIVAKDYSTSGTTKP